MSEDWRALAAWHIKGQKLQRRTWEPWSKQWDFDHCNGCNATFANYPDYPGYLTEGYTTTSEYEHGAGYKWICPTCFAELKDEMGWVEVPSDGKPITSPNPDATDEHSTPGGKWISKG